MKVAPISIGDSPLKYKDRQVGGEYITADNELFYKISHIDQMICAIKERVCVAEP